MARDYARIMTAIWDNATFLGLGEAEQRAYLLLVTQPDISAAGVLSLRVRRWASMSATSTPDALADSLKMLEGSRFVVIDETTEELLIRSFIKWDAGFNNPKRQPVIVRARDEARSELIREKLDIEFRRCGLLPPPPPPTGGRSAPESDSPSGRDSDGHADSLSTGDGQDRDSDRKNDPFPQEDGLSDRESDPYAPCEGRVPQPATPKPPDTDVSGGAPPTNKPTRRRRTQLPASWRPTDTHVEYASANGIDIDHEVHQFRAHAAATERPMANWNAAFTQWLGKAKQWLPQRGHLRSVPPARLADPDAEFARIRAEADGTSAARLVGRALLLDPQSPDDPTPPKRWRRDRTVEWIDAHESEIRARLTRESA